MGNRVSARSRHNKPTSADASTTSTRTGKSPPSSGSVSKRLRAAAVRVGYRRSGGGGEQVVSCPNLGDEAGDTTAHLPVGGRTADVGGGGEMPDVTVYRSYEMTATPDDDDEAMNERGRLTAVADSVPDIKIYRRSAVLYTGDDDDDYVIHRSNHRSVCLFAFTHVST